MLKENRDESGFVAIRFCLERIVGLRMCMATLLERSREVLGLDCNCALNDEM